MTASSSTGRAGTKFLRWREFARSSAASEEGREEVEEFAVAGWSKIAPGP